MSRLRRTVVLLLVAVAAGALTASSPAAEAALGVSCHANGANASCLLSEAVSMPLSIGVSMTSGQPENASVTWTVSCARNGVPVSKSGSGSGMTPFTARLSPPATNAADCTISATVTGRGPTDLTGQVVYTLGHPFMNDIPQGANYSGQPIYDLRCLADPGNNPALGTKAVIMGCETLYSQAWTYRNGELIHGKYCLTDPKNGGIRTKLVLYTCTGAADQLWTYHQVLAHAPEGEWILKAHGGSMCLDDPKTSVTPGTQLIVFTCNGGQPQKWYMN
jgi:Ricin-type beta-trefoil lectin domain